MGKTFDAVAYQRQAREKLSREYLQDREAFLRSLREKYGRSEGAQGVEGAEGQQEPARVPSSSDPP